MCAYDIGQVCMVHSWLLVIQDDGEVTLVVILNTDRSMFLTVEMGKLAKKKDRGV